MPGAMEDRGWGPTSNAEEVEQFYETYKTF